MKNSRNFLDDFERDAKVGYPKVSKSVQSSKMETRHKSALSCQIYYNGGIVVNIDEINLVFQTNNETYHIFSATLMQTEQSIRKNNDQKMKCQG